MAERPSVSPTAPDRDVVIAQLERMLGDPLFRNSKRFPPLLRRLVMLALENRTDRLRERDLGVDVFGRNPDYDTNVDPVVRVTVGEIRKRLERYYSSPGHEGEIRLCLPSGSYIPEFRIADAAPTPLPEPIPVPGDVLAARRLPRWQILTAILVLGAAGAATARFWPLQTPLERMWAPLVDTPDPVFICVGETSIPDSARTTSIAVVGEADVEMLSTVVGYLAGNKKAYIVRGVLRTSLADLRKGPALLVGAFNNAWTIRLTEHTRFSFQQDESAQFIGDRQNPAARDWSSPRTTGADGVGRDYALITRTLAAETDRMVIVAAGIHRHGTAAAGEFLTNPKYMEEVAAKAPPDWYRKSFQIVLATNVINGNSGPPRVVAVYFW